MQTPVPQIGYQDQCATGLQVSITHPSKPTIGFNEQLVKVLTQTAHLGRCLSPCSPSGGNPSLLERCSTGYHRISLVGQFRSEPSCPSCCYRDVVCLPRGRAGGALNGFRACKLDFTSDVLLIFLQSLPPHSKNYA